MEIISLIKSRAKELSVELIEIRRHLHQNPELSMEEEMTASYIASQLEKHGIPFEAGIAGHGIIAHIKGNNPESFTIALRADMDALPIAEENNKEYKSCKPGIMHACGHDAHMTCLLGAAFILQELKDKFQGTVRLIFQPSEEKFPGGASMMIKEGVLENPKPYQILGQHVLPTLEAGKVGFKSGPYMASTDEVYLTIKGRGGHAATPELNIDPVLIASHILVSLQQIVSRNAPPTLPAVLSFGRFIAEGRTNIIPSEVKLEGTLRTFDEKWRAEAHIRITRMAESIAESMGGTCQVFIDKGYPFLVNDVQATDMAYKASKQYLGDENVVQLDMRMTAEDFAYYAQQIPGCFYRLGVANQEKGITHNLHTPLFDIDESSLETGAGLMAWLTYNSLMQE